MKSYKCPQCSFGKKESDFKGLDPVSILWHKLFEHNEEFTKQPANSKALSFTQFLHDAKNGEFDRELLTISSALYRKE